jgi:hypothetical protein
VLEMPYKLIALGDRERLLFDVTRPEGENIDRNLIAKHPEIAIRLEAMLKSWASALNPPGLPTSFDRHHEDLFAEHNLISRTNSTSGPAVRESRGAIQEWICRNGAISVKNGTLWIQRETTLPTNTRTFITTTSVDLNGPVTATLSLRAIHGGKSTMTWRTRQTPEFTADSTVSFDWPTTSEWREVTSELPIKGRLIHLRITPATDATGLEVRAIELRGNDGTTRKWRFDEVD